MRRRLALVSLAVVALVVVSLLLPLAVLVRNQAQDRALSRAEREAKSIAAAVAVLSSGPEVDTDDPALIQTVLDSFGSPDGISVILPSTEVIGEQFSVGVNLDRARSGSAFTARISSGAEVLVPVLVSDGPASSSSTAVVVRAFVPNEELTRGVIVAWFMLGGLGVFLILVAVWAADRFGRSVVRPVTALSEAAHRLGRGELDSRVDPDGPEEIAEVGKAFNTLARQLGDLLSAERESLADLSHRLRTPLAALRLQAGTLSNQEEAAAILVDIEALEGAVDFLIEQARAPDPDRTGRRCDMSAVVRHRGPFWKVLADEQGRATTIRTSGGSLLVGIAADELGVIIDTLLENVFAHTPAGTSYSVTAHRTPRGEAVLVIEDDGPGFSQGDVMERGVSGAGGTGLGLDIVRRTVERHDGAVRIRHAVSGGARVEVSFPIIATPL
ncbi:sensor protein RstB [bacterium BMS3Bbin02]|nr:sensor protein RstB [bacterium BMS3Bbin02]HDH25870.1 HAMP domain-containing protein [Actinomycetota bacterium]